MKKPLKIALKSIGIILLILVIGFAGLIAYLSVTEFKPADRQPAETAGEASASLPSDTVRVLTWNTGYAGLDADADFFMDGGREVRPTEEYYVGVNLDQMAVRMQEISADFYLLQELDRNSSRTYGIEQLKHYEEKMGLSSAFAYNYKCPFVPIPFPPLGRVESGVATLSGLAMEEAERVSLPCPFSWPVSAANLKRCLLVTRTPVEGTDKELVIVNLHLEAYDSGEGKIAQTKMLMDLLVEEYEKGNYVIAGGDFNQAFPGSLETYPIEQPELWMPGLLEESSLPEGWQFAWDTDSPTCRLLNEPYNAETTQHYIIDGFIVSPNVEILSVETVEEEFFNSDHNPSCWKQS